MKSHGNSYGFALGSSCSSGHPLVIDPGIEYSTYLGGSGSDRADGVAVDAAGNAYVTGRANSGFPTTAGASTRPRTAAEMPMQQAERDRFGPRLLDLIGGATAGDSGLAISIDGAGSAYITGSTGSTDFPTTAGAYDTSSTQPRLGERVRDKALAGQRGTGLLHIPRRLQLERVSTSAAGSWSTAQARHTSRVRHTRRTSRSHPGAFDTTQNGGVDSS